MLQKIFLSIYRMTEEKMYNPWSCVKKWEEFLYFCCPECNVKYHKKDIFIKHALSNHPMAKMCLESIKPEVELKDTHENYANKSYVKEECTDENNIYEEKLNTSIVQDPLVIVKNEVLELSETEEIDNFDSLEDKDNILDQESAQYNKVINLEQYDEENSSGTKDISERIMKKQSNYSQNKCNLCDKSFSNKSYLIFHISVDHPENNPTDGVDLDQKQPLKKPISGTRKICDKKDPSALFIKAWTKLLRTECGTCGNAKCHLCHTCNEEFSSKSETLCHIGKKHKDQRPYKCEFCALAFNVKVHFKGHILGVHEKRGKEERKVCQICNKSVRSPYLPKHIKEVHENKKTTSKCTICNKTFNGSYIKIHMRAVHEKIRRWKCEFCIKDFAFQEGYLSHVRSVHEKVKLLCDICGDSFNQRVALKKHKTQKHEDKISEQHKNEGSPFPCNICEKILFTSELLKDHLQFIHNLTKEEIKNNCTKDEERLSKPLVCELCNGTFNYRASLKQHIKVVHDGHKDFVCDQCGSSSSTAANLKKHVESIHRGSTKCSCTICGKVFRDSNVMKFHVRSVHEKKKDYICEECGFPFYLRLALKAHLAKVHSIGTTYDCQECGKKFGKKTTLSLHTDTVHNGVKHQCDQCVKSFTQRANLRKHILKHHS